MEPEPVGFCDFHPHENIFSPRWKNFFIGRKIYFHGVEKLFQGEERLFHDAENYFQHREKIKASSSSGEIDGKSYKYTSVKKKL